MNIIQPTIGQNGVTAFQQQQSVAQTLNQNVDVTSQQHLDINGWPDLFARANVRCTCIRVGATGTTVPSGYSWTSSNTKIAHNLGRQPVGWLIVYKDKVCDIFAPNATKNDGQFIYLTISDPTANTTLLIF